MPVSKHGAYNQLQSALSTPLTLSPVIFGVMANQPVVAFSRVRGLQPTVKQPSAFKSQLGVDPNSKNRTLDLLSRLPPSPKRRGLSPAAHDHDGVEALVPVVSGWTDIAESKEGHKCERPGPCCFGNLKLLYQKMKNNPNHLS